MCTVKDGSALMAVSIIARTCVYIFAPLSVLWLSLLGPQPASVSALVGPSEHLRSPLCERPSRPLRAPSLASV